MNTRILNRKYNAFRLPGHSFTNISLPAGETIRRIAKKIMTAFEAMRITKRCISGDNDFLTDISFLNK
jgi:hypothetical protein